MTIEEIFKQYDAPWEIVELACLNKEMRELGNIYGVVNNSGSRLASYISLEDARLIRLVPDALLLIYEVAKGDLPYYNLPYHRSQAKLLLKMLNTESEVTP